MYPLLARTIRVLSRARTTSGCQPGVPLEWKRNQVLVPQLVDDLARRRAALGRRCWPQTRARRSRRRGRPAGLRAPTAPPTRSRRPPTGCRSRARRPRRRSGRRCRRRWQTPQAASAGWRCPCRRSTRPRRGVVLPAVRRGERFGRPRRGARSRRRRSCAASSREAFSGPT